jgi:hypothetical protein
MKEEESHKIPLSYRKNEKGRVNRGADRENN